MRVGKVAYIDSQSGRTAQGGQQRGYDGGKKVQGRNRHTVVDSLGLLLAVVIIAANVDDARAAQDLFAEMPGRDYPRLSVVRGDDKYHNYEWYRWISVHRRPYGIGVVNRPKDAEGWVKLGGGANVRLARALSATEQGLREADGN